MRSKHHQQLDFLLDQWIDLDARALFLEGDISEASCGHAIRSLLYLESINKQPITIYINSEGGEVVSGLGLIDVIRSLQSHVNGIVIGAAYSMASCILQACDTRVVTPHSTLMVHWGSGDKNQLAKKLEPAFLQIYLDRIRERHPSYTYQKLDKLLYTDTYMSAREAIELGLADSTTIPVGGQ